MSYTPQMGAPTPSTVDSFRPRSRLGTRLRNFWQRVSEGRQIDVLWAQFAADARASYGFYRRDVDWDQVDKLAHWRRPLYVAKQFFWALVLKLSPARRVLLLAALALFILSALSGQNAGSTSNVKFEWFSALLLLLLLSLELADKVIMKRDLEIAREIQSWLVPSAPPEVPDAEIAFATRPQNSVAGDYYDAFYPTASAAEGGKLMLVVADVAGKSVPAALLMATMQASLRTLAGEDASLTDLVARLNRYACAHSQEGRRFTTAIIGQYEPGQRRLTYVNAGHNAAVLRRTNGFLETLDTGGLPLGIQARARYETATIEVRAGDLLTFFTDGVVEAFNADGEEFGNDRWLSAIRALPDASAQSSLQFLMQCVDDFVGATRQSDDITCLIFRCK